MCGKSVGGKIEQRCKSVAFELRGMALCGFMLETKAAYGASRVAEKASNA